MPAQEFDVIVYGATGFTGRLVAEHLLKTYGGSGQVRWAMAGRDAQKLRDVGVEHRHAAALSLHRRRRPRSRCARCARPTAPA